MNEVEIAVLIIKGALELLAIGKDYLSGQKPDVARVEAVWSSLEQVAAKMRTDAIERERYGDKGDA